MCILFFRTENRVNSVFSGIGEMKFRTETKVNSVFSRFGEMKFCTENKVHYKRKNRGASCALFFLVGLRQAKVAHAHPCGRYNYARINNS